MNQVETEKGEEAREVENEAEKEAVAGESSAEEAEECV